MDFISVEYQHAVGKHQENEGAKRLGAGERSKPGDVKEWPLWRWDQVLAAGLWGTGR